jgi:Tol biopolymer transport system component
VSFISRTFLVPSTGGPSVKLLPDFASAVWPVWSPDGRFLLLTARRAPTDPPAWWVVDTASRAPSSNPIRIEANFVQFPVRPWRWLESNRILYSASLGGDSWDLWEVQISPDTGQALGAPRRFTTGASLATSPSVVRRTQQLVFASLAHTVNVWSVPVEANSGRATGPPERVTESTALQMKPSASVDGRRLLFWADKPAGGGMWMKALETGGETLLVPSPLRNPVISADGSRAAYATPFGTAPVIYTVSTSGGTPEKVCADCGESVVQAWSRDNTRLLYLDEMPLGVFVLDLRTGAKRQVLRRAHELGAASFSPDERWISVLEAFFDEGHTRLWVVPFKDGVIPAAEDWVPITGGESWDERPRWSPDGTLLYFASLRDGFYCLWAIRLQPGSKRPAAPPFPVQHFHNPRLSINNTGLMGIDLAVTPHRIFVNLGELSGNIWTSHPRSGAN